ncbi:uncharacterized protein N0V89_009043 [Didymosphaeria variabile]|uniref:Uncharacterized protein n=1 Tax=Didymosphaeria variabile TaxID=1932322 RepID=A0A9W9C9V1_9PLEO|nr:uncharacterized protein N0V89_009043 [Didymosphaeria variabile]KAJ4350422.1 hypothetical protein N0V89_009043 [Didymosphaeria variabile]
MASWAQTTQTSQAKELVQSSEVHPWQKKVVEKCKAKGIDPQSIAEACGKAGVKDLLQNVDHDASTHQQHSKYLGLSFPQYMCLIELQDEKGKNAVERLVKDIMSIPLYYLSKASQDIGTLPNYLVVVKAGRRQKRLRLGREPPEEHARTVDSSKEQKLSVPTPGKLSKLSPVSELQSAQMLGFVGTVKKRILARICDQRCHHYVHKKRFLTHAFNDHKDLLPDMTRTVSCCEEQYYDAKEYLAHIWDTHSDAVNGEAALASRHSSATAANTPSFSGSDAFVTACNAGTASLLHGNKPPGERKEATANPQQSFATTAGAAPFSDLITFPQGNQENNRGVDWIGSLNDGPTVFDSMGNFQPDLLNDLMDRKENDPFL